MKSGIMFRIIGMLSFIFGLVLFVSLRVTAIGAIIGTERVSNSITIGFATFFLIMGLALFVTDVIAHKKEK
jgi:uncharacterized membrane protein YhiD involved in acid resistance